MKIIQIVVTDNNSYWPGWVFGLGDDGVLYVMQTVTNGYEWAEVCKPIVKKKEGAQS